MSDTMLFKSSGASAIPPSRRHRLRGYIEQITYLLFLKMADEKGSRSPRAAAGRRSETQRNRTERPLHRRAPQARQDARHPRDIYSGAQSRFNNPVNLKKLVSLIDDVHWTELGVDVEAAAYEGPWRRQPPRARRAQASTSRRAS